VIDGTTEQVQRKESQSLMRNGLNSEHGGLAFLLKLTTNDHVKLRVCFVGHSI
jgi:hypothetical protein